MARLIPTFTDDRTPPGEQDVFNLLASGPDDWVALHSLDLSPWNRGLRTEIDFVIIIPDTGILCIEVKSHEQIGFDDDRWYPATIKRSPFKQAADGSYTFCRRLAELAPRFRSVPVGHSCIFPRAVFEMSRNLAVQPWELMDSRVFKGFEDGDAFCDRLKSTLIQSIASNSNSRPLDQTLSAEQVDTIVRCCVPVQKRRPNARDQIVRRAEEMEKILREQQKPVLDLVKWNERVLVSGGAGTGKTLIAMEVARRAAEQGRRVGLLCFNQLVGNWMKETIERSGPSLPNLVTGRAIRVMADMTGIEIPDNATQEFWDTGLPQQLEERLTDPDFEASATFDYLVLDEAQDLLARPRLWHCLTQFLSGGLTSGGFAIFGDFEHQVLGAREPMRETLTSLRATTRPVSWALSENCRNYRIVGDTAVRLAALTDHVYTGYRRPGGSIQNYNISFYESETEQLEILSKWLEEFEIVQGYKPSEITLLSFRADHSSAAEGLKHAGHKLRPARQPGSLTAYTSVHAFKGMENKIIILTDVALNAYEFQRDLFYVGLTRATESVRVLCESGSQEILATWLAAKGKP